MHCTGPVHLGLKSVDHLGSPLIEREAVWVVPPHLSQKPRNEEEEDSVSVWSQRNVKDEEVVFSLHECALRAYEGKRIHNPEYNVYVPLEHLVPELLLTDLPDEFKMDRNQLEVNLDDYSTILGAGGAGAVYRGKYVIKPLTFVLSFSDCVFSLFIPYLCMFLSGTKENK